MRERLAELKAEFAKGQQHLQALDEQRAHLRDTLLRISGAIQVLEELLADTPVIPVETDVSRSAIPHAIAAEHATPVTPVGTDVSRPGALPHTASERVEQNEQESNGRTGELSMVQ